MQTVCSMPRNISYEGMQHSSLPAELAELAEKLALLQTVSPSSADGITHTNWAALRYRLRFVVKKHGAR